MLDLNVPQPVLQNNIPSQMTFECWMMNRWTNESGALQIHKIAVLINIYTYIYAYIVYKYDMTFYIDTHSHMYIYIYLYSVNIVDIDVELDNLQLITLWLHPNMELLFRSLRPFEAVAEAWFRHGFNSRDRVARYKWEDTKGTKETTDQKVPILKIWKCQCILFRIAIIIYRLMMFVTHWWIFCHCHAMCVSGRVSPTFPTHIQ